MNQQSLLNTVRVPEDDQASFNNKTRLPAFLIYPALKEDLRFVSSDAYSNMSGSKDRLRVVCLHCQSVVRFSRNSVDPHLSNFRCEGQSRWAAHPFCEVKKDQIWFKNQPELTIAQNFIVRWYPGCVSGAGTDHSWPDAIAEITKDGARYSTLVKAEPAKYLASQTRQLVEFRKQMAAQSRNG